ncbi:MAG: hypothetical protein JWL88_556 [Parcubacteria group bacterium]|nr:hypothetical protein [Parcubacteria group bacterium]
MNKLSITSALIASLALTGCATAPGPQTTASANTLGGGAYLVGHFPGIPSIDGAPAIAPDEFGPTQFKQLQYLDQQCHLQMDPYIPSAAAQIGGMAGKFGLLTGIGGAVGTGLGAIAAFTGVSFIQYLKYGGLAAMGSGLGSGAAAASNQYNIAKRYVQYACMQGFVARASQKPGGPRAVIIPWAGPGNARPMTMPTTTVGAHSNDDSDNQDSATAPPPPM